MNLGGGASAVGDVPPGVVKTAAGYSAFMLGQDTNIWGTSVPLAPTGSAGWVQVGSGMPIGSRASVLDVNGITAVYALNSGGAVVGINQLAPGGSYGAWGVPS